MPDKLNSEYCASCGRSRPVQGMKGMTVCTVCGQNLHHTVPLKGYMQASTDDRGEPASGGAPQPDRVISF